MKKCSSPDDFNEVIGEAYELLLERALKNARFTHRLAASAAVLQLFYLNRLQGELLVASVGDARIKPG